MNLINLFDIDTLYGTRSFKLMEGDIADVNIPIDIVIAGAFKGGYNTTPGSLFGSLKEKRDIIIDHNYRKENEDFRELFGTLYYPIQKDKNIKAILILEMVGRVETIEQAIQNLHITISILETKGHVFKTIMMLLLC